MKNKIFILIQFLIPHHIISRLVGRIAESKNRTIKNFFINLAIKKFQINMDEAKEQDINKYESFNEFFIRELKDGVRPLDEDTNSISSPADGILTEYGKINDDKLIQAKGKEFSLKSLIADDDKSFDSFATVYLSPRDYHRVHMPIDGKLTKMTYIPGKLFSVNETTTKNIDNIFGKNERLVCYFDTRIGEVAVIFVGALLVAGIETVWQGKIAPSYYRDIKTWEYDSDEFNISFKKGEQLGWFNFGSTVVMLFPNQSNQTINFKPNNYQKIMVNQQLATLESLIN